MSIQSIVAARYADVLYKVAAQQALHREVYEDMVVCAELFETCPAMKRLLMHPTLSLGQKSGSLTRVLTPYFHARTVTFVSWVIHKRRIAYLPAIARHFMDHYKVWQGLSTVYLTTARSLVPETLVKVKELIGRLIAQVPFEVVSKVDLDLVGGYVLKVQGKQLDMSLRGRLGQLKTFWQARATRALSLD